MKTLRALMTTPVTIAETIIITLVVSAALAAMEVASADRVVAAAVAVSAAAPVVEAAEAVAAV